MGKIFVKGIWKGNRIRDSMSESKFPWVAVSQISHKILNCNCPCYSQNSARRFNKEDRIFCSLEKFCQTASGQWRSKCSGNFSLPFQIPLSDFLIENFSPRWNGNWWGKKSLPYSIPPIGFPIKFYSKVLNLQTHDESY